MIASTIIFCVLFTHIYGMSTIDKEFNRNIFDDEVKYTMINPESEFYDSDPQDQYFRQIRAFKEDYKNVEYVDTTETIIAGMPKPRPFRPYYDRSIAYVPIDELSMLEDNDVRSKRSTQYHVLPSPGLTSHFQINDEVESPKKITKRDTENEQSLVTENNDNVETKHVEKPLEIRVLDLENNTDTSNITHEFREEKELRSIPEDNLIINDFIRFKREADSNQTDFVEGNDKSRPKRERESNDGQGKTVMTPDDTYQSNREPRGATKQQWIKQPYPVRNINSDTYEDSEILHSDSIRGPNVHFVTQRRSESSPPPVYRSFDGEARGRELNPDMSRRNPYDYSAPYDRDYYTGPPRRYETYPPPPYRRGHYRNEYPHDPPLYDSHYESNMYYEPERPAAYNKQRRIIYYATLPEVVRSPPASGNYRDRYDNRYVSSTPLAVVGADPYRYSKPYPLGKSRYDENERSKSPYALKVSTDVNVREIKKNPERRIYSESDPRYGYGVPPYRADENTYGRRP